MDRVIDVQQYDPLIHQQLRESKIQAPIACVASISTRVCLESWDKSKKKKWMMGEGEGKEGNACLQTPRFWKTVKCGLSVDYLALETSIKQGMLCLHASQIWSHLICGRRLQMVCTGIYIWIVFVQRFIRLESSKYKWRSSQWRLQKANWLRMTACGSDWKKWTVCWR